MYQENELKKLYVRLKAQYPQYQLEFLGDSLILKQLHSKVEVTKDGVKLYVNGNLYDQFTSEYVDDSDDLYELIEAFLLDIQHAGMKQGNETYIFAAMQAAKMGSRFLIGMAICFTLLMIGLITANSPWLFLLLLAVPAAPSSPGSVSPDGKTNSQESLSALLGLSRLRPTSAHGRKGASLRNGVCLPMSSLFPCAGRTSGVRGRSDRIRSPKTTGTAPRPARSGQ